MNLKLIDDVFHDLFDGEFSIFIYAGKFLAVIIFVFTIGKKAFKSFSIHGMTFSREQDGLSPYDILRGLLLLAAILSITEILTLADKILLLIENIGTSKFQYDLSPMALYNVELEPPDTGSSSLDLVLEYLRKINENLNPLNWIMKVFYLVLWMVDMVLFVVFIAQRFFFMGIIKLFSPIVLALSILPEYKMMSYNLAKVYARNFLIIIPYMLVFVFANKIHDALVSLGYEAWGGTGSIGMTIAGHSVRAVALLATVIIKIMLLRKSGDIMKQIIA